MVVDEVTEYSVQGSGMELNLLKEIFSLFFYKDSSQIELLKELLDLQKDMIVMMLSLLEGDFITNID